MHRNGHLAKAGKRIGARIVGIVGAGASLFACYMHFSILLLLAAGLTGSGWQQPLRV